MSTAVLEKPTTKAAAKIAIPLRKLQQALAAVAPAVERRTTIPVLSTVRIEQTAETLNFASTNLDLSIQVKMSTPNAKAAGPFLLAAHKVETYAKLLSGDEVGLSCTENRATLTCGRSRTQLPLQSASSFPELSAAPGEKSFKVSQEVLSRLLRFVSFAVTTEEARYVMRGALLEIASGKLHLVATDGHRLARYSVASDADNVTAVIPDSMLSAIAKGVDGSSDEEMVFEVSDEQIFASVKDASGEVLVSSCRLTGQFPDYRAVMPQNFAACIKVDAQAMTGALRRCLQFSDANTGAVKLTISTEDIKLKAASSENGETEEAVDVESASTSNDFQIFAIGFNGNYLLDAFSRLSGSVEMRFSSINSVNAMTIVAEPKEGELFEYVAMPMRV